MDHSDIALSGRSPSAGVADAPAMDRMTYRHEHACGSCVRNLISSFTAYNENLLAASYEKCCVITDYTEFPHVAAVDAGSASVLSNHELQLQAREASLTLLHRTFPSDSHWI